MKQEKHVNPHAGQQAAKQAKPFSKQESALPAFHEFSGTRRHFEVAGVRAKRIARLLARYTPLSSCRLLDDGCGYGRVALELARMVRRVDGVDPNPRAIAAAQKEARRQGARNAFFHGTDGKRLPFPDASFDAVLSYQVYEHVQDPARYLAEARRVLKDDGVLYITVLNKYFPVELHYKVPLLALYPRFLADAVARAFGAPRYDIRALSRTAFARELENAGFSWRDETMRVHRDPYAYYVHQDFGRARATALSLLSRLPGYRYLVPDFIFLCRKKKP